VSDIDTVVVDSLKALDPEWPIREADMRDGVPDFRLVPAADSCTATKAGRRLSPSLSAQVALGTINAATLPRRRDVIFAAHYDCLLAVASHRVRGQRDHRDLPRGIVRAIRGDDALRGCHTCALCVGIRTALNCVPAEGLYVRRRPPLSARAIQIRMQAPMKPAIR
jgi:hypothetical protein